MLVPILILIPDIQVDLKYATKENFLGEILYASNECYIHEAAGIKLAEVQTELREKGLSLKVWDCFRPMEVQERMWEKLPDERYVSDPKKGGRHTRGTAIDVTLATKEGVELVMPSAFDDFTEKAWRSYQGATEGEIANRTLLEEVMERHGFIGLPTEWWHFDLVGWESFPPVET